MTTGPVGQLELAVEEEHFQLKDFARGGQAVLRFAGFKRAAGLIALDAREQRGGVVGRASGFRRAGRALTPRVLLRANFKAEPVKGQLQQRIQRLVNFDLDRIVPG